MGCCESTNTTTRSKQSPPASSRVSLPSTLPISSVTYPITSQPSCSDYFENTQIAHRSVKQAELSLSSGKHPEELKELFSLVYKIDYYYNRHDIDSAAAAVYRFQCLLATVEKEYDITPSMIYCEMEASTEERKKQIGKKKQKEQGCTQSKQKGSTCFCEKVETEQDELGEKEEEIHTQHQYYPQLIQNIKKQHRTLLEVLGEVDRGGWEDEEKTNQTSQWTRREEDDSVSTMLSVDIDFSFEILLYILQQPSLYKNCIPFTKVSREEKHVARNSKIGYSLMELPVLACRQSFFKLTTYSRLRTHGEIVVIQQSLVENEDLQERVNYKPAPNKDHVPANYKYILYRYKPESSEKGGKLTGSLNLDFGISILPMFLKERVLRKLGASLVETLTECCLNFKGSDWQKKLKGDPSSYVFFKQQIESYLSSNLGN